MIAQRHDGSSASRSEVPYSLFAIHYASSGLGRPASHNFMTPVDFHDMPLPLDFFVWVAIGGGRAILIDSGSEKSICRQRGHDYIANPAESLAALGLKPEDVTDIIVTHMHWDHLGNLADYSNAQIHVHKAEMAHATGCAMWHASLRRPYDVTQVCDLIVALYGGRVSFTEESAEIAPGIRSHHVGGHAPGLQVVQVQTVRGTVVVASDAMHFFANSLLTNPFPVIVDVREYLNGLVAVERLAESPDHVIPGHDPLVRIIYPPFQGMSHIFDLNQAPAIPRSTEISALLSAYGRLSQP